jgi:hypothetical protein
LITILSPLIEWAGDTDDADAVTSRNKRAMDYLAAGRTAKAVPLLEWTLADCKRILGRDHPTTIRARSNLAMGYRAAGRTAEAIPVLKRTLADCERVLGTGHPETRAARDALASWTGEPQGSAQG